MCVKTLNFKVLPEILGICRLDPKEIIPEWAYHGDFFSITKTTEELSIVCAEADVPADILCERGWKAFEIQGTLDFGLIGIVASVSTTLAQAGLGIVAMSTYNTDYILVKGKDLDCAVHALRHEGHEIIE